MLHTGEGRWYILPEADEEVNSEDFVRGVSVSCWSWKAIEAALSIGLT